MKKTIYNILGAIYIYILTIIFLASLSFGDSSAAFKDLLYRSWLQINSLSHLREYLLFIILFISLYLLALLLNYFLRKLGLVNLKKIYLITGGILGVLTILHLI